MKVHLLKVEIKDIEDNIRVLRVANSNNSKKACLSYAPTEPVDFEIEEHRIHEFVFENELLNIVATDKITKTLINHFIDKEKEWFEYYKKYHDVQFELNSLKKKRSFIQRLKYLFTNKL